MNECVCVCVTFSHVAELIELPVAQVEKKYLIFFFQSPPPPINLFLLGT